jgi:NAD(P)H-dependent flavin oxidoreductase YrpB (nitropropane dioxygenase family)
MIDIMIEEKVAIFVCAVGLPPKHVVERLHKGGVLYMNMCGHPKHARRAAELGADLVCAQGGEGGGHTGDIPTIVLLPAVHEAIQGFTSPYTGKPVQLIAAGGIYNGQSLAAALMLGAAGVWVGTRFILSEESGASARHQEAVRTADHGQIVRSTIFTGRPINSRETPYLRRWEGERREEMLSLQARGIVPVQHDLETKPDDDEVLEYSFPLLMGSVSALVKDKLPAKQIVDDMVNQAANLLDSGKGLLIKQSVPKL